MSAKLQTIVWNHITREYGTLYSVSVDQLEKSLAKEGNPYDRSFQIIPLLKRWSEAGFGQFIVGRRGSPTRVSFPKPVAKMGEPPELDSPPVPETAPTVRATTSQLLDLPVPLRPDLIARLQVPEDITAAEAERLCAFLRMLPVGNKSVSSSIA